MNTRWNGSHACLALLAMSFLAAGCGVSKAQYLAATQSAETLTAKNQELQKNLDAANARSEQLAQQVGSMQASMSQVNADLERQKQANSEAQSTYEGMMAKLREEISSGQVEIQQMRDGIRVNLAQDILFKSGSSSLDAAGKELLIKVADQLKASTFEIVVTGHTDDQKVGPRLAQRYPTNWELGAARAGTVVRAFQDAGIGASRMLAVSAGENRPRSGNDSVEGRALNRRIEIRLRPIEVEERAANPE